MGEFEYRQAEEIRDAFARHGVRYLFLGKSAQFCWGFLIRRRTPICFWQVVGNGRSRPWRCTN